MNPLIGLAALLAISALGADERAVVGSKAFTESYVLAEIAAQAIEGSGAAVTRKTGLGGTGILFEALENGSIDLYPEYTGTISEAIIKKPRIQDLEEIRKELLPLHLVLSASLGFSNTYALALKRSFAEKNGLTRISDLVKLPSARAGFSHEFMKRADGLPALARAYGLRFTNVASMEHSLTYEALKDDAVDVIDAYSTDAKIAKYDFVTLRDDLHFFPSYYAVFIARESFVQAHPALWNALNSLQGRLTAAKMTEMNAEAEFGGGHFPEIARKFLGSVREEGKRQSEFWVRTRQHLSLVGLSLLAAILVGIPLGIAAARRRALGQMILLVSSIVQTVPSLALFCFLIPIFGIGTEAALAALFLYGLLPIVVGTHTGLTSLDTKLIESAEALGLSSFQRLAWIELPLASPIILAGIKTATIIGIGTATIAALIGAGGYGTQIVEGLALNSPSMMLEGAIPAAGLALLAHFAFEGLKFLVPRGIR